MKENLINCVAFLDYEQAIDRYPDFLKDPREYNCKKTDKSFASFFREYSKELIERFQDFLVEQDPDEFEYSILSPKKSSSLVYRFKTTEDGFRRLNDLNYSFYGLCKNYYKNYRLSEMRFERDLRDPKFVYRENI